ncbi:MAG: SusC/RagA family TonB-linked outer membrane protein, partial [Flammeovirgaceae bacterium]
IFQNQGDIDAANGGSSTGVYQSTLTRPGDFRFKDIDGDGVITSADQEIVGNAQPQYIGGWNNQLSYKGFDFSFFFQFVQGNTIWNHTRVFAEGMNSIFGQFATTANRWTPNN